MNYELYFEHYLPNLGDDKKKFIKETDLAHKLIVFQSAYLGFIIDESMVNTSIILSSKNQINDFIKRLQNYVEYTTSDMTDEALSIIKDEASSITALLALYELKFFIQRKKISDLQTGDIFKFNDKLLMKTSVIDKYRNETLCVEPDGQAKFYPNDSIIE